MRWKGWLISSLLMIGLLGQETALAATLDGRVLNERSKGVPAVRLTIGTQSIRTEKDGRFHLEKMTTGKQFVTLQQTEWILARRCLDIKERTVVTLRVVERPALLWKAKTYRGTPYKKMDCSQYVHRVYADLGLHYAYVPADAIYKLPEFEKVEKPLPGDLILFGSSPAKSGHVGIVVDPVKRVFIGSQSRGVDLAPYNGSAAWGDPKYKDKNGKEYYKIAGFYRFRGK